MATEDNTTDLSPITEPITQLSGRSRMRPKIIAGGAVLGLALSGAAVVGVRHAYADAELRLGASWDETSIAVPHSESSRPQGSHDSDEALGTWAESSTIASTVAATAEQSAGVVIIATELGYSGGEAAGTGMVLTSDGVILTNHHVVQGATEITVTDPSTGTEYQAVFVGADSSEDVAVLRLVDASGLVAVDIDDDSNAAVGDAITAVGNASGGGVLVAAEGTITELESSVTTSSSGGSESQTLDGMIEINADVVSGDSGGALLDEEGEVIGMNTAASVGGRDVIAYAVPIDDALIVVESILDGEQTSTNTLGYPPFLGVAIASENVGLRSGFGRPDEDTATTATDGAVVLGVYEGTPAAAAGLVAGDTVTAVDGVAIASGDDLRSALALKEPGATVILEWTDATGAVHSATVTLIEGPVA